MSKSKLLIIDNNKEILRELKSFLQRNLKKVDIFLAETSEQAFKLTKDFNFDLIISEFSIETLDGLKFLKLVRKNNYENPFILFTSDSSKRLVIRALNNGVFQFIEKGQEPSKKFPNLVKIISKVIKENLKKQRLIKIENKMQETELKLHEVLKDREVFLEMLIKKSPFGIYLYDLDANKNLIFKGSNPYADKIMKLDHSTFIGKKILDVFPNLEQTNVPYEYKRIAQHGGIWETEQMGYHDNRISGVFEVKAFQIKPGSVFVMFDDITSKKTLETQKQKYIEDLKFLAETSFQLTSMRNKGDVFEYIGNCLHDLIGDSIIVVSSYDETKNEFNAEHICGISKKMQSLSKILGKNPNDIQVNINTDCLKLKKAGKLNLLDCSISELTNNKISEKQVKLIWKLMKLGKVYTLATVDDGKLYGNIIIALRENLRIITNQELIETFANQAATTLFRIEKEEKLLQREYLFSELVKNMNDGFSIVDLDGNITYANDKYCEILGYSREEILGHSVVEFLDDENNKIRLMEIKKRSSSYVNPYQIHFTRKNGSKIPVQIKPMIIFGNDGSKRGLFAVITDISAMKKAENELRLSKEELQIQKDELESFASTVSHDIRGRLQIIAALIDMQETEYTSMIIEEINELTLFINNLLFLARKGSILGKFVKLDLSEVIQKLVGKISSINSTIKFSIKELPKIDGDPVKLNQVFDNIIMNIHKHANASLVEIYSEIVGDYHMICIKDNGVGITEKKLIEIKESWKTRRYKSFGMQIVLKIVNAHNGKLDMESIKNKGTTVKVFLPKV